MNITEKSRQEATEMLQGVGAIEALAATLDRLHNRKPVDMATEIVRKACAKWQERYGDDRVAADYIKGEYDRVDHFIIAKDAVQVAINMCSKRMREPTIDEVRRIRNRYIEATSIDGIDVKQLRDDIYELMKECNGC